MQDSKRDTDVKNRLLGSVGEGEGRMIWENSTETCILPYKKEKKKQTPDNHNLGPQHQVRWSNCAMLDNPRLVCISVCDGPDNPARKQ